MIDNFADLVIVVCIMPPLKIEMRASGDSDDDWKTYDITRSEDPFHGFRDPTSDDTTDTYLYGVVEGDDEAVVLKAADAVVFNGEDAADPSRRELLTQDVELIVALDPGESHTMTFEVEGGAEGIDMRFTHLEE